MYGQQGRKPPKSDSKVTFVLRHSAENLHCAGINSLRVVDEDTFYTASRDATVRRWSAVNDRQYECSAVYEAHVDWVNDVAVLGGVLATCSSDRAVMLWDAGAQGQQAPAAVLGSHSDYVTCLAAAPQVNLLASGGLKGEALLWDVATATKLLAKGSGGYVPAAADGLKESVYSLAMHEDGTSLAVGTASGVIRVVDARTGEKILKLKGHTDNVRALLLNRSGTHLLSAGSDHSIRLWDLGQQRCLHTWVVHTDSVWTLDASPNFEVVYSGGRDKCVYRTNTSTRECELLFTEEHPVQSLALQHQTNTLLVATEGSAVNKWQINPNFPPLPTLPIRVDKAPPALRSFLAGHTTLHRARQVFEGGTTPPPQQTTAIGGVPGIPPIVDCRLLPDKRYVLTKDGDGNVARWDLVLGMQVEQYGKVDIRKQEVALFEPKAGSPWVTLDRRFGCLACHLQPPQCFLGEVYARDLGEEDAPDELKFNLGHRVLCGLFEQWRGYREAMAREEEAQMLRKMQDGGQAGSPTAQDLPMDDAASLRTVSNASQMMAAMGPPGGLHRAYLGSGAMSVDMETPRQQPQSKDEYGAASPGDPDATDGQTDEQTDGYTDAQQTRLGGPFPFDYLSLSVPPSVMLRTPAGLPWSQRIDRMNGHEKIGEVVPDWVAMVVLEGKVPAYRETKLTFFLLPAEGSTLPVMDAQRLTAPRILKIHKVAEFAITKMAARNIRLTSAPIYVTSEYRQPGGVQRPPPSDQPAIEIICNGQAVPYDMTLAGVHQYIWKQSKDLVLNYRLLDPRSPAPLPVFTPPT